MSQDNGPVLIEIEEGGTAPSPADAPAIAEVEAAPSGQAMQTMAALTARRGSALVSWFWRLALAVVVFFASVAAWDFLTALIARSPLLGMIAAGLLGVFVLVCLALVVRELAAMARLRRVEKLQSEAAVVRDSEDLAAARAFSGRLVAFYKGREDTRWGRERLTEGTAEAFDASTILSLAEDTVLKPLDGEAMLEVEAAARQVATVTALVPMAFADVLAALVANLRMIRRIAEIYGGRSGTLGSWRLTRAVFSHLVATGAVAVGDDLIGSVAGGSVLSKLSRRFGEGLVNGALTARVGVAAMEVCRPLPYSAKERPSVTSLVKRALTGLFGGS